MEKAEDGGKTPEYKKSVIKNEIVEEHEDVACDIKVKGEEEFEEAKQEKSESSDDTEGHGDTCSGKELGDSAEEGQ